MSVFKTGTIEIVLKSDLCIGSGYSYAGIVDSDCCYDECGLPYIPARRLRGCMRETLESLLSAKYSDEIIEECFGKRGAAQGSNLIIGNAYIDGYEEIRKDLLKHKADGQEYNPQAVLERFTHIIGQTKIKDGTAEKGSLRYTRVVNRYSPIDGAELRFKADISFEEINHGHNNISLDKDTITVESMLCDAVRATRHIGLKRNRGLGNVVMRIPPDSLKEASDTKVVSGKKDQKDLLVVKEIKSGEKTYTQIYFAIKNIQPLMLSATEEDRTRDYILGQQVLGLLAGLYISINGENSTETEEFKDLFLNEKTKYTNLYPYDGEVIYYPAPDYLNRLKKTKKLVFTIKSKLPDSDKLAEKYKYKYGNQPKKLKGKFVAQSQCETRIIEVDKDIVYHHSHRNVHEISPGVEEGILYPLEVIRPGQMFAGSIIVPNEKAEVIQKLLLQGDLYFGKSRSTQYGRCKLIDYHDGENNKEPKSNEKNSLVVVFKSDAIILNDAGQPTVYYDEVCKKVYEKITNDKMAWLDDMIDTNYLSSIQTSIATGYLSKWNLRKPSVPIIKAGSYITYKWNGKDLPTFEWVGERNREGYGQISYEWAEDLKYDAPKKYKGKTNTSVSEEPLDERTQKLIIPIVFDQWLERKILTDIKDNSIKISNSATGRITLMLKESVSENRGDPDMAFKSFTDRINSIKSDAAKSEGIRLINKFGDEGTGEIHTDGDFMKSDEELNSSLKKLSIREDKTRINNEKKKRWDRYVMSILVDRKYNGR